MNQILERIKTAYHLETDAEVANFLGIKPSTLSMQKNRGKLDLVRIIEKCSDLNKNWLLDGVGPMRQKQGSQAYEGIPVYSQIGLFTDGNHDQVKGIKDGRLLIDGNMTSVFKSPASSEKVMGYIVSTNSMKPTLIKNDIILVDTNQKEPEDGGIYMLSFDDSVLCRRIKEKPGNKFSINGDNESFDAIEVPQNENDISVIGKVIVMIRSF